MNSSLSILAGLLFSMLLWKTPAKAQNFYLGADLSYVNEMEDCGVQYRELGQVKDPYQIFAERQCNLVRLRLWHTPAWYNTLNAGKRYGDLTDVRKSIARAKAQGMQVLLDFQLSDFWADPSRQIIPNAWLGVVDNLPLLNDSLYGYIARTLTALNNDGLLPEIVQIGNETNRGILLSPQANAAGWSLDWNRNSQLFKRAIEAVRDVETTTGKNIQIALHIAGPANASWLMEGFWNNGVTDFDIIGLSYYWAWHKPTSIADAGNVVTSLKQKYPGKEVMMVETAYQWTNQWNDNANNIMTELHPAYSPASPENQLDWLVDLTQEMINKGAIGLVCWEPAWVSSACWTPWGQGSHQEHAAFFDFQNNLILNGGIQFFAHDYANLSETQEPDPKTPLKVWTDANQQNLFVQLDETAFGTSFQVQLMDTQGAIIVLQQIANFNEPTLILPLPELPAGTYYCSILKNKTLMVSKSLVLGK